MPDLLCHRICILTASRFALALAVLLIAEQARVTMAADQAGVEFFEKKVRPVLVKHCYQCHSADAKSVKGELRLDLKLGWQKGGESGEPAVVPGKPNASPLILAVRHDEDVSVMPPDQPQLSDEIIADLTAWVRMGAPDPRTGLLKSGKASWEADFQKRRDWWSLRPVAEVSPPKLAGNNWSNEPVDRFILAELRKKKLDPASRADGLTLLRRLSFLLTGLPPAPEEVRLFPPGFSADPGAALVRAVDRLLASPHFGERIARHWMDVVRYTDTYGYEWDNPAKGSWEYRDYLIRAFNHDVGFDQLIREQIAGDLLATPRIDEKSGFTESLIGPMFYHMGEHRHGDNTQINGVREEMIDNKIDAFSKAFLAMTVACARCHNHKLDAISQADYYALAGIFMTPRWTSRSIESPQKKALKIAAMKRLREAIRQRTAKLWTQRAGQLGTGDSVFKWAVANRAKLDAAKLGDVEWILKSLLTGTDDLKVTWLETAELKASAAESKTKLILQPDGSILAQGEIPQKDSYSVTFRMGQGTASLLRLEALTHASLGQRGPGRTPHGNFVLSHLRIAVKPFLESDSPLAMRKTGEARPVKLASAQADYSQPNYPVADALLPLPGRGWGVGLGGNVDRTARFKFAAPVELPHGGEWTVTLEHGYGSAHILGRFRLTPGTEATQSDVRAALKDDVAKDAWRKLAAEWRTANETRRKSNVAKFKTLTDLTDPKFPEGWVTDGAGIRHGWVQNGQPLISLDGESVVQKLLPRGWHTHALSSKLAGAVRLPTLQRLPGKFVSLKVAGGEWSGYLRLADNGFQTETVTFLNQPMPTWRGLADFAAPNGIQTVVYEFATSDLNPNFPPRTGVANVGGKRLPDKDEGFEKRSWFSITGIVSHDQAGQPEDEIPHFASLFEGTPPDTSSDVWRRTGGWLARSLARYETGKADADDVRLINWLLSAKLLPNSLADDPQLAALVKDYRKVEESLPFPRTANSMDEREVVPVNYALNIRGDIDVRGDRIPRSLPRVFAESGELKISPERSGRRQLAEFLTSERHGLAARVYVNRVWQWVFGTGLVRTPNDFGHLGEQPSHPKLLDFLTRQFIADGWSTKRLLKRLLLTKTFRQSGTVSPAATAADPGNRLLHHYPTRRLEAEAIRDSLLQTSGRLDVRLFGRPINPRRHVEDPKKRLFSGPVDGNGRRSIYLEVSIMDRSKFLQSFNAPDPKLPTGLRDVTNVPTQALVMLNDPFVIAMADHCAGRLIEDGRSTVGARVRAMFVRVLGRPPSELELARWINHAQGFATSGDVMRDRKAWQHMAHTMFNLQEFLYYR